VFKLTQAMGGGKAHNLLALGLRREETAAARILAGAVENDHV